jgi:DNA-binding transcriptional ArsR family regulator
MKTGGTIHSGAECRAQIMTLLRNGPMTVLQLIPLVGRQQSTVNMHLLTLKRAGRVHVAARTGHNLNEKLYAIGRGEDASDVPGLILDALKAGPMTASQLEAAIGQCQSVVRKYLKQMREAAERRIHVCGWVPVGTKRAGARIYALGNRPNKPKPPRIPLAEVARRARAKKRAQMKEDPSLYLDYLMRKRRSYVSHRAAPKADPFMSQFAGLFGGSAKPAATNSAV